MANDGREVGKGFNRRREVEPGGASMLNPRPGYNSWGMTRTPKNILSHHRRGLNGSAGLVITSGATSQLFKTENQRFLFIEVSDAAGGTSLTVNGSMHAGSGTARSLTTPDLPTINAVGLYKIDISGVDQVSFTVAGGEGDTMTIFAACSTF